jgi:hypothetical protein
MEDSPYSGRPSRSATEVNLAKVKEIVTENPHSTLTEIAIELSVSHESIRAVLIKHLCMKHIAARLFPKDLNFLQKFNRMRVAKDMLEQIRSDPNFMKCIVTGDGTWDY